MDSRIQTKQQETSLLRNILDILIIPKSIPKQVPFVNFIQSHFLYQLPSEAHKWSEGVHYLPLRPRELRFLGHGAHFEAGSFLGLDWPLHCEDLGRQHHNIS